jgi:hypothetical protein
MPLWHNLTWKPFKFGNGMRLQLGESGGHVSLLSLRLYAVLLHSTHDSSLDKETPSMLFLGFYVV